MSYRVDILIAQKDSGRSIKDILKNDLCVSSNLITKMKENPEGIMVGGERKFVTHNLKEGEKLTLILDYNEKKENIVPTKGEIYILYEDEHIIAVNKSGGVPVHPSQNNYDNTLSNHLKYYFDSKNEEFVPRILNRLDRNTSGVVVLSKNPYVANILSQDIKECRVKKEYLAVVKGILKEKNGEINAPIARKDGSTIERTVDASGKYAITQYELIKEKGDLSLVKVITLTGRTHQIRVHFAYIGHPLLGDFLYGEEDDRINRHALHCNKVVITHPITKQKVEITSPMWEDMRKII